MSSKQFQVTFLFIGILISWLCITSWISISLSAQQKIKNDEFNLIYRFKTMKFSKRGLSKRHPATIKKDSPLIQQCHFYNISDPNVCVIKLRCYMNDTKNLCLNVSCYNCNLHYYGEKTISFQYNVLEDPTFIQKKICRLLEEYYYSKRHDTPLQGILRCVACNQAEGKRNNSTTPASLAFQTICKPLTKQRRKQAKNNITIPNIHLIYFRFFSRQEFRSKFHQTYAQLMKIKTEPFADVYNFAKHQSTKIHYIAGLYQLLCGEVLDFKKDDDFPCSESLAKSAAKYGYRTYLFDHTCEESTPGKINRLFTSFYRGFDFNRKGQVHRYHNDLPSSLREKTCRKNDVGDKKQEDTKSGIFDYHRIINKAKSNNGYVLLSILRTSDIANSQLEKIDSDLASVIKILSRKKNSVIILTGDIGHGWSLSGWNNSKITQLSNPPLYIVLSKHLQKLLGKNKINNISRNIQKLVTLKDVHFTLREIIEINDKPSILEKMRGLKNSSKNETIFGLFQSLQTKRTCAFLNVTQPHICLTDNQAVSFDNDSIQVGLAEFVLGKMNEKIQIEIETEEKETDLFLLSPFGNCQRLKGISFGNINRWRDNSKVLTQMDINVIGKDPRNLNILTVLLSMNDDSTNPGVKILSYRRKILSNDDLQICFRGRLDYDLCRCVETVNQSLSTWRSRYLRMVFSKSFGVTPKVANIHNQCLLLIMKDYTNSIIFEAVNICEGREYILGFYIETYNMISLESLPIKKTIKPLQIRFLTSIVQASYLRPGRFTKYKTYFSVKMS